MHKAVRPRNYIFNTCIADKERNNKCPNFVRNTGGPDLNTAESIPRLINLIIHLSWSQ